MHRTLLSPALFQRDAHHSLPAPVECEVLIQHSGILRDSFMQRSARLQHCNLWFWAKCYSNKCDVSALSLKLSSPAAIPFWSTFISLAFMANIFHIKDEIQRQVGHEVSATKSYESQALSLQGHHARMMLQLLLEDEQGSYNPVLEKSNISNQSKHYIPFCIVLL